MLLHSEGNHQQMKRQPTKREEVFPNHIFHRIMSETCKEFIQQQQPD